MRHPARYIGFALLVLAPVLALVPLARIGVDWFTVSRVAPHTSLEPVQRGYDWVEWVESDGLIRAGYLHPKGPAAQAGLRPGDVFHELDYLQYFTVEDLRQAIAGGRPGSSSVYTVMRNDQMLQVVVPVGRELTFLYPLSGALWHFSLWGFAIGAFLHLLGLRIVVPLARHSRRARFSLLLIAVSSLWIIGNLLRLMLVELLGPPLVPGATYDNAFHLLTLLGLAGWLAFPALLLHKVLLDARFSEASQLGIRGVILYVPAAILAAAAALATVSGAVGPLTLNALATSILFYACLYIASAAGLMFLVYLVRPDRAEDVLGRWNRTGSLVTLVLSVAAALIVLIVVLLVPSVSDQAAGWFIVGTQLLSIAPVVLVSHATLQHGKIDQVLSRGMLYLALLGLFFFAFVGGMTLLEPYMHQTGATRSVIFGLYVIALLLVFGRIARSVDSYTTHFLTPDRRRVRRVFGEFAERIRTLVDLHELARDTAHTLAEALDPRSVAVFLRRSDGGEPLVAGVYHPEPPFVTDRFVSLVWPHLQHASPYWARNAELGGGRVPIEISMLLQSRSIALAVPIVSDDGPSGLLLLGEKRKRRAVYNLEDVDVLRSAAGQVALAQDRMKLVERERALVRESAEAHLVALRAQINPHFLFNALNTIAALISEQPREAEEVVERVASIFRHTLQAGSRSFVSLGDELDLVSQYLHIEKARFGEKLVVEMDVAEALRSHPVPAFCVQTLVENAVKHGIERSRKPGVVGIRCEAVPDSVRIVVSDSGVGIPQLFDGRDDRSFYGVGLKNVSARLQLLYGTAARLKITSMAERGTTVELTLPLSTDHVTAEPPVSSTRAAAGVASSALLDG